MLTGSNIAVTPGSGETLATHVLSGPEHQTIVPVDGSGHIKGSKPIFLFNVPFQVHFSTANSVHWSLWNGSTKILRVVSILQLPAMTPSVSGVAVTFQLSRTTTIGNGTTGTAWPADTGDTLDANVSFHIKPSSGAAEGTLLREYPIHSEETNTGSQHLTTFGGMELVPELLRMKHGGKGIVLRNNQGLRCEQVTASIAGNSAWLIALTQED